MWLEGYGPCFLHICLVSSDFHLFGPLKKYLAGKWFVTDADMKQPVTFSPQHLVLVSSILGYKPGAMVG